MALLTVPVHLQDRFDLCGPACAQMVARALGSPLTPQRTSKIGTDDPAWFTTPTRLETSINSLRPHSAPPYVVSLGATFTTAMGHVTASLTKGFPAVVLADGGEHWVVVRGISGSGNSRFVHVRDPFPDRTLVPGMPMPLPAHADQDSCDDADQLAGANGNAQGESDEVVRWTKWKTRFFTPCAYGPAPWNGHRVVIAANLTAVMELESAEPMVRVSPPTGESDAIELSRKALADSDLATEAGWADAIHGPASFGEPHALRIERTDGGPDYFLVVLTDPEGRGIIAELDGETGELTGARLMARRIARSLLAPPPPGHRRYVWQSSRNSFYSPYFPFSEVVQHLEGPPVYQRMLDRKTFRDLAESPDILY